MPDGSHPVAAPVPPAVIPPCPAPFSGPPPRWGQSGAIALLVHLAVVLPLVIAFEAEVAPAMVAGVEIAPEMDGQESGQPESVAEAVPAVAAESVPTASVPPPEPVEAAAPPEAAVQAAALPEEPAQAAEPEPATAIPPDQVATAVAPDPQPAPEPLRAEAPPPDAAADTVAEAATDETLAAALPPPPPPMLAPPRPVRPRPVAAHAPAPHPAPASPAAAPAPAPAAAAASAAPSAAPAHAVHRRPSPGYVAALLAALERHKDYPISARHRRAEGVALLRFAMRRDGAVTSWRIERSSGDAELDAAVAQMVRRASPLPPPPGDLPGDPIELVVPVRFVLR